MDPQQWSFEELPIVHNVDHQQWSPEKTTEPTCDNNTQQYSWHEAESSSTNIEKTSSSCFSSENTSLATTLSDFGQHHVKTISPSHVLFPLTQNLNAFSELLFDFANVYHDQNSQGTVEWEPQSQADPLSMLPPKPTLNHLTFQQHSVSAQLGPEYLCPSPKVQYEYSAKFREPGSNTIYAPLSNTFRVNVPSASINLPIEPILNPWFDQNQGLRVLYDAEMYDALHTDLAAMDRLLPFHEDVHLNPPSGSNEDVQYLWGALKPTQNRVDSQFVPSMQSANSTLTTQPQLPIHSSPSLKRDLAQESSERSGNQYSLSIDAISHLSKRLRTRSDTNRNLSSRNVVGPLQISNTPATENRPPGRLIAPKSPTMSNIDNFGNQSISMREQCPGTSQIVDGTRESGSASFGDQNECFGCRMRALDVLISCQQGSVHAARKESGLIG
ncbi:hypothetical protein BDZ45DRAFT_347466 [Acephala macrosclerotiorum]|nr:hypothetical protein BDZ45DRAFT_347466 [Acephala macrosclerotiorum]